MSASQTEPCRGIVEGMCEGVALLDREGRYQYLNPIAERILGSGLAGTRAGEHDGVCSSIELALREAFERLLAGHGVQLRRSYYSGGRWYEVAAEPTHDGILLLLRDITDRLNAESARHAIQQRFQLLVEGVKDYAIISLDLQGHIRTWNTSAERITGYTSDEILGKHFAGFYTPEDVKTNKPARALEQAILDGRYEDEGWRVKKDGTRFLAWVAITPLYTELGDPSGFAKVSRDVTDRYRATEALRMSEERLRLAVRAAEMGVWEFPLEGHRCLGETDTTALVCDARAKELWGIPPGEEVNRESWLARVHPDDRERVLAAASAALDSKRGGNYDVDYRVVDADRERVVASRGRVLFDEAGRPRRYLGVVRDITYNRDVELFRERLTGIFAHDLRSPLSAIRMAAQSQLRPKAPEAGRKHAELIDRSVGRMSRMLDQLLDFTRIQAAEGMLVEREHTDLAALCADIVAEAEMSHPGRAVRCEVEGDCRGVWDASQIARVLQNLVGNALQYGSPERPVDVKLRDEGAAVTFTVHNEGAPIPSHCLAVLFDPFSRGARDSFCSRTARLSGLGLGLYISRAIVRSHDGDIAVTSSSEEGTTFSVRLPRV